ncbi:acyl-CoA thioesterase [Puniceicoccales bacterium CK1056]|uniref:Acyl-CoA thioesterase n=1 Tax=Oceanipulchritudo coccoides TaxID=2706888 RepID=A0A6B2M1E2_9BACT|nr:thioesterase family protein [Oceanipulchritudo coccoides]NDV62196.1 acyl-CoA thioesterase [Oceanipulchritudo coccoides]
MSEEDTGPIRIFQKRFTVPRTAIDRNGHVNNVVYVQWMQDLAIKHWQTVGGETVNRDNAATWVARSHHIEYLRPAFEGDELEALTWISNLRRVRSLRKYTFRRVGDKQIIARGETDWVFIDVQSGHPKPIPDSVPAILPISPDPA